MQQAPLTCYTQRVAPMYTRRQALILAAFIAGLSCVLGGITRGPLISLPVPGAIYIRWVTDVVATNRIDLGFTPSYEAASWPTPSASEHEVVLTGAPDGAVIYYRVVEPGEVVAVESVFRVPPASDQSFRFAAIGDFGTSSASSAAVAAAIPPFAPWLLISVGDNVYENGAPSELDPNLFTPFKSVFSQAAFMPALGNHDIATDSGFPLLGALSLPENGPYLERTYSYDYGNIHFTVIDSTSIQIDALRPAVLNWLDQDLAATLQQWKVVYYHHPPYTSLFYWGEEDTMREFVVPILERRGVHLAISGHNHTYERINPINGIHYITTGAGGRTLYGLTQRAPYSALINNAVHSYMGFEVMGSSMIVRCISKDLEVLDEFLIDLDHPFKMDGLLDRGAVGLNGCYASLTGTTLYLAYPDTTGSPLFSHLYINSETNSVGQAPGGMQAQILTPDLYLQADHSYGAHSWGWNLTLTNALTTLHASRTAPPSRGVRVVEGTIDLEEAFGGVPEKLYLAKVSYTNGLVVDQWPAPAILDTNIVADEYFVLDLVLVANDFPAPDQTNTHYAAKGDTIRIGMDPAHPGDQFSWQQLAGPESVVTDPATNAFSFTYDDISSNEVAFLFSYAVNDSRFAGTNIQRVVFVPSTDSDGDGLLDYEEIHGIDVLNTPFDPTGQLTQPMLTDSDSDGISDAHEVYAGTDANSPSSRFVLLDMVTASSLGTQTVRLYWSSAPDRHYRVLRSVDIDGPYEAVAEALPATPPINNHLDLYLVNQAPYYYQIQVLNE